MGICTAEHKLVFGESLVESASGSNLIHIVSVLDFTKPSPFREREDISIEEKDLLQVVTTLDYEIRPAKGTTRFYRKEARQEDYGTDNRTIKDFQQVTHASIKEAIPKHFSCVQDAVNRHKEGMYL